MGVIKPTQTGWDPPIDCTPTKDRTIHFCDHYCKLNAAKMRDSYPKLRMDGCIYSLRGAPELSTLSAKSRCRKVKSAENDQEKPFSVSPLPFTFYSHAHQIKEYARNISTSSGHPFDESQVAICRRLFRRYRHIFTYTRRTYRWWSTVFHVIIQRRREIEAE